MSLSILLNNVLAWFRVGISCPFLEGIFHKETDFVQPSRKAASSTLPLTRTCPRTSEAGATGAHKRKVTWLLNMDERIQPAAQPEPEGTTPGEFKESFIY
ncbi:hypothetical protein ACRALDRAFT_208609 [Sodiomyces alcalophilus JCM 7366]|uniref:uncharacterized protein n=1 Tax=Sodiomyces alcalophilus JCM 7366 TaxID=591952 RepID=UPI0039B61B7E